MEAREYIFKKEKYERNQEGSKLENQEICRVARIFLFTTEN